MKKNLVELYEGYLNYCDEKEKLEEEMNLLRKKLEEEMKLLKEKHRQEKLVLDNKIKDFEKHQDKNNLIKKLQLEHYPFSYDNTPNIRHMFLTQRLHRGQKISSMDYFKKQLENKVKQELILVEYTTKHKTNFQEYEDYERYLVKKTLVSTLFVPKNNYLELAEKFSKMNLEEYRDYIKNSSSIFLIEEDWKPEKHVSEMKILENEFQTYMIYLNSFNGKKGVFRYDKYNKDLEYDKIVLKTLDYIIKSEKLNKLLSEQEKIKKQLEEQEQLKKQLKEDEKKIENTKQQLKKFDFEQEL